MMFRSIFSRGLSVLILLVIGTIFGPLLIAAVAAISPSKSDFGTSLEASKLVDAYRDQLPRHHLFLSVVGPGNGKECGYEPDEIFPDSLGQLVKENETSEYLEYAGYYALHRWSGHNQGEDYIAAITANINANIPQYEIAFLRRCIESTVFSGFCAARVSKFGDQVARYPEDRKTFLIGSGHEERIICTFVDGVAARRGMKLVDRKP